MSTPVKRATIYLDPVLHKALKIMAAETSSSISDLVNLAVREALKEDAEDLAAFEERAGERLIREDNSKEMTLTMKARRSYIFVNRRERILDLCLSYRDFKENGHYAVECPELRLMDQGKTKAEAYEHLAQNIFTTLVVAIETGNLQAHLRALGFKERKIPVPDAEIFEIPYSEEPDLLPLTLKASLPVDIRSGQGQFQLCM